MRRWSSTRFVNPTWWIACTGARWLASTIAADFGYSRNGVAEYKEVRSASTIEWCAQLVRQGGGDQATTTRSDAGRAGRRRQSSSSKSGRRTSSMVNGESSRSARGRHRPRSAAMSHGQVPSARADDRKSTTRGGDGAGGDGGSSHYSSSDDDDDCDRKPSGSKRSGQVAKTRSQIRRVLVIADQDVGPSQGRAAVGVVHRHPSGRTGSGPAVSTAPPQWSRSWISFKTLPHTTGGVLTTSWRIFGAVSLVRLRICSTAFGESPTSNS